MMAYEPIIEMLMGDMKLQMDGEIMCAVQEVGVQVDKDELIRALQYDRGQYEKGYEDGKRDAVVHGRWLYDPWVKYFCSVCDDIPNFKSELIHFAKYCPHCGAMMDLEEE